MIGREREEPGNVDIYHETDEGPQEEQQDDPAVKIVVERAWCCCCCCYSCRGVVSRVSHLPNDMFIVDGSAADEPMLNPAPNRVMMASSPCLFGCCCF